MTDLTDMDIPEPAWSEHNGVRVRMWPDGSFDFDAGDGVDERLFMPQSAEGGALTLAEAVTAYQRPMTAETRAEKVVAIKAEAGRRILNVATLERQSNDLADIAMTAWRDDLSSEEASRLAEAMARRVEIDRLRSCSNALEAVALSLAGATLLALNPADDAHWTAA